MLRKPNAHYSRHPRTGLLSLLCCTGKCSKIWSAFRQHEIQHTELRMKKYMPYLTCVFFYTSCTTIVYTTDDDEDDNNLKKMKFTI